MKPVGYISAILLFTSLLSMLLVFGELFLLDAYPPQPSDNLTMKQWKASFQMWAFVCGGTAGVASLLWYILAQWTFKINRWENTEGKRPIWGLLLFLPIIIIVVSCFRVERAESSLTGVYLLFFLNGLLPYYLATLLFSPSSFKYTPILAKPIRSLCFW